MVNINNKNYDTHVINTNNPHAVTKTQVGLSNVLNIDTSVTTNITDTSSKRFVSDTEKTSWSSKKDTLPGIVQRTITSAEWWSVAYGNGIFVAVGSSGTNRAMRSTDGITWTAATVENNEWRSVAYGNGVFVAVASTGVNRAMRSTDGITWTAVAVSLDAWRSVTYGNGIFVAVATGGTNRAMWSVDGITWTAVSGEANEWRSVAYGNGVFVAVATGGTNRAMWSVDGVTWSFSIVEANDWRSVTYGNGIFVAVASGGTNRAMWSVDGVTWTTVAVGSDIWYSVTYGNGIFVALSNTSRLMWSTDGTNWYYRNIPLANWYAIAFGDGMFVALAYNSSNGLLTIGNRTYSDKSRVIKKSVIGEVSVTILPADWTGTGPFEDTISISISGEQITNTTHDIKITPVWSGTIAQKKAAMQAYSYISESAITSNNTFTLTCYDYKPEVELTLNLEVWRKWQ